MLRDIQKHLEKITSPQNRLIFEKFISTLNEEQLSAVLHNHAEDGPLVILACAGSGKTRVLTLRIVYLILSGVNPSNIFAATFTEKAAYEMKRRVISLLDEVVADGGFLPFAAWTARQHRLYYYEKRLWISTFHSAGLKLLLKFIHSTISSAEDTDAAKTNLEMLGFPKDVKIITESLSKEFSRQVAGKLQLPTDDVSVEAARSYVYNQKSFLEKPKAVKNPTDLERFYRLYCQYQKETGYLDFQDLINLSIELLEKKNDIRLYYRRQIEYMLVDEFQDTSFAELAFLRTLAGPSRNLFVVGDDDQTIYSWHGANPENFNEFLSSHRWCKLLKLEKNYRSTVEILRLANNIFKDKPSKLRKTLLSTRNVPGEKTVLYQAEDDKNEALFIADEIKNLLSKGVISSLSEVMVLTRLTAQFYLFQSIFEKVGLKTAAMSVARFWNLEETTILVSLLSVADFLFSGLEKAVEVPKEIKTAAEFIFKVFPFQLSQQELNSCGFPVTDIFIFEEKAVCFLQTIPEPKRVHIKALIDFFKTRPPSTEKLTSFCNTMLSVHGYTFGKTFQPSEKRNIEDFIALLERFDSSNEKLRFELKLSGFIDYLIVLQNPPQAIERDPENRDAVKLATVHRVKGLEFPVVFVAGLEDGIFPHKHYTEKKIGRDAIKKRYAEEKRLFYVAVTRAQNRLYLTYAVKRMHNNRQISLKPSRYLKLLPSSAVIKKSFIDGRPAKVRAAFHFKQNISPHMHSIVTGSVLIAILILYLTKPAEKIRQTLNTTKEFVQNTLTVFKSENTPAKIKQNPYSKENIKTPTRAIWIYNRGFTLLPVAEWALGDFPTFSDVENKKYIGLYNSDGKISKLYPVKTAKLLCKIDPDLIGKVPAPEELFEGKDIFLSSFIEGKQGFLTVVKTGNHMEYTYINEK